VDALVDSVVGGELLHWEAVRMELIITVNPLFCHRRSLQLCSNW